MPAVSLVVSLFVSMILGTARPLAAEPHDAVRAMDAGAAEAVAQGREASPAFRQLVARFEGAPVVIHVLVGETQVFATVGATQFAAHAGGWTFLRIVLDGRLRDDERVSVLAHELQHAQELLDAGVQSQHDVRRLYERIGRPVPGTCDAFETAAAIDAGTKVWRQLREAASRRTRLAIRTQRARAPRP